MAGIVQAFQSWMARHPFIAGIAYSCGTAAYSYVSKDSSLMTISWLPAVVTWLDNILISGTQSVKPPTPSLAVASPAQPQAAPSGSVSSAPSAASGFPVNQQVVDTLKAENYRVFVNPNYKDGVVYGIGSPAGFTWWAPEQELPIMFIPVGKTGQPAGTGKEL